MYGIEFYKYENLTAQKMEEELSKYAKSSDPTIVSRLSNGLLVFIMTHGNTNDRLYGSDGKLIFLKTLTEMFESHKCSRLKGKPKIFIIHACRGDGTELAISAQHRDPEPAHREGPPPSSDK